MAGWANRSLARREGYYRPRDSIMARAGDLVYSFGSLVLRISLIVGIILVAIIASFCIYAAIDAQMIVESANLPDEIIELAPENNEVDLVALAAINSDIVGWLVVDGTNINYPVLKGEDNDYYLARDYMRKWATAGSIFMDYRNSDDLSDTLTVIYGHRMGYGKMFSDVTLFADGDYFASHLTGSFFANNKKYNLRTVAFALMSATEQAIYDVSHSRDGMSAVHLIYENAKWRSGLLSSGRFVLLSTCDARDRSMRDILLMHVE